MFNIEDLIKQIQELNNKNIELKKENNELKNTLTEFQENSKSIQKEEIEVKKSLHEQIIGERVKEEIYSCINLYGNTASFHDNFDNYDNNLYNSFNYFKNKEEVEKHAKHKLLSLKLIRLRDKLNNYWIPDWNKLNEEKFFIYLYKNKISYDFFSYHKFSNLYFKTKESREEFLRLIPKEEILEYLNF